MRVWSQLINFDTKTLIGVLVWGNIAMGIIVCLYQTFNTYKTDYPVIRSMILIRFLSAFGYLLLFYRGVFPDLLSVNTGNTVLFTCYFLEAQLMSELVNVNSKKLNRLLAAILGMAIAIFNLTEWHFNDSSLRVTVASILIFFIYLPPTVMMLASPQVSRFKRGISVFYVFLLCALIPRSIGPLLDRTVNVHTNNYYQTLMFLSLILMMASNTIIYLLFMKEQADTVIEKMATTDQLTNILNRHRFLALGKQIFENHKTNRSGLGLLFFDIDHFKNVNDRYGHHFGDEVLIRFADILKNSIRPHDLCCRYGGEEFVLLLSQVNENINKTIANRIMRELESHVFETQPGFHVTTSVGSISGIPKAGELLEDYIQKADDALYQAKKAGRNRMVTYGEKTNT